MICRLLSPRKKPEIDWRAVMRLAYGSPTDINLVWKDRDLIADESERKK